MKGLKFVIFKWLILSFFVIIRYSTYAPLSKVSVSIERIRKAYCERMCVGTVQSTGTEARVRFNLLLLTTYDRSGQIPSAF